MVTITPEVLIVPPVFGPLIITKGRVCGVDAAILPAMPVALDAAVVLAPVRARIAGCSVCSLSVTVL